MEEKAIKETMEGPVTTTTINRAITEEEAATVAREAASSVD